MNLPDIVNVALGLVLLYVLLSSIASLLFDLLSNYAQYREEILYVTINRLLAGKPDEPWDIERLVRDRVGRRLKPLGEGLLRVPLVGNPLSRFFFERVMKGLVQEHRVMAPGRLDPNSNRKDIVQKFWDHPKIRSLIAPGADAPATMEAATFANVLIDLAVPRDAQHTLPSNRMALLRSIEAPSELVPKDLQETLRTLGLSSEVPAGATGEKLWGPFRKNVASWFDEASKRATEMYRRSTQIALLWMGFVLALILNADSFRIIHVLSHDQPLREAVATYAEKIEAADKELAAQAASAPEEDKKTQRQLQASVDRLRDLEGFGFPLGWLGQDNGFLWYQKTEQLVSRWVSEPQLVLGITLALAVLLKILGLGVTALAVSLGAPFWYSAMHKLLELRRGQANRAKEDSASTAGDSLRAATDGTLGVEAPLPLEIGYDLAAPAAGFEPRKAYWLAKASLAVYSPESEVEALVMKTWRFHDFAFFSEKGTQAFCAVDKDTLLIAFRGTEVSELNDIITDARCNLVAPKEVGPRTPLEGRVHQGFQDGVSAVWKELYATIDSWRRRDGRTIRQVFCTGHSLGGALATLAFLRLSTQPDWPLPALYTFGCPKVGNDAFSRSLDRHFPERIFRFIHQTDIVPQLPPLPDYHHCGQEYNFEANGKLRHEISGLGRLLGYASVATEGLKKAGRQAVDDHSMSHYVVRCEALVKIA